MRKTILVTGPIGSGKSVACSFLESRGFPVYDCDSRTKRLYTTVPGLKKKIESDLGIDFSDLAKIFYDGILRSKLENIVFPLVLKDIEEWKNACHSEVLFIESAIMLEKKLFDGIYDEVWMIDAPLSTRALRNEKVDQRNSLQTFRDDDPRITRRLVNDSSREELYKKLEKWVKQI